MSNTVKLTGPDVPPHVPHMPDVNATIAISVDGRRFAEVNLFGPARFIRDVMEHVADAMVDEVER